MFHDSLTTTKKSYSHLALNSDIVSSADKRSVELFIASSDGDSGKVRELLENGTDPDQFNQAAASFAAKNEDTLSEFYGYIDDTILIREALKKKSSSIVKRIIDENPDIKLDQEDIYHLDLPFDILDVLVDLNGQSDMFYYELARITLLSHPEEEALPIYERLLQHPEFKPNFENNELIKVVARKKMYKIVKLLLENPQVSRTLSKNLHQKYSKLIEENVED